MNPAVLARPEKQKNPTFPKFQYLVFQPDGHELKLIVSLVMPEPMSRNRQHSAWIKVQFSAEVLNELRVFSDIDYPHTVIASYNYDKFDYRLLAEFNVRYVDDKCTFQYPYPGYELYHYWVMNLESKKEYSAPAEFFVQVEKLKQHVLENGFVDDESNVPYTGIDNFFHTSEPRHYQEVREAHILLAKTSGCSPSIERRPSCDLTIHRSGDLVYNNG
jgi:hypothetical protein